MRVDRINKHSRDKHGPKRGAPLRRFHPHRLLDEVFGALWWAWNSFAPHFGHSVTL